MVEPRKKLPGRHSLFWKLAVLLVGFCLLMIWLSWYWGRYIETRNAYLNAEAHQVLNGYAAQAEQALNTGGQRGIDQWLKQVRLQETGWVGVVGSDLQSLGSTPLTREQSQRLTFMRGIDWPMSTRQRTVPWLKIAFPGNPDAGSLVIELPERFKPGRYAWIGQILTNGLIPALFTLLLCVGLYRLLIRPLNQLREQANAWRADRLSSRLSPQMTERRDELGELNRAFDHMAARLHSTVQVQQQLLRDLSHELRTPLSRLRVACDSEQTLPELRERLSREVDGMRRLVDDTLQLAWLDTEREKLPARIFRWWRCGRCWWMTPVSKPAGRPVSCAAIWTANAGSVAISIHWPRRWKTFCVTPSATRRPRASCALTVAGKGTTGCCGWKIRAAGSTGAISSVFLRRSSAWMAPAPATAVLAWA
jgi:two-component system sensor histidine kinase PfeS